VEQPPQSRSTPPPPAAPLAPARTEPPTANGAAPPETSLRECPDCGEMRQAEARYCEECGYDFGTEPVPPPAVEERSRLSGPVLWLVVAFWAILAIGGLWFIYTALYSL
jgi:hypothetical protein